MKKTRLPAFPTSSLSTSASSSMLQQPRHFRSHMPFVSLLVALVLSLFLLNHAHAAQISERDAEVSAQKQGNDEHGHSDVRVDNLDRHPVVKNPQMLDNQRLYPGDRDPMASNINNNPSKQEVPQKEARVVPEKSRVVPLVRPVERLQEQETEAERNEQKDERKLILKQKIEERDRVLSEQLRQQQMNQQQARIQQQNFLEHQKEQQREQYWLKEVHRKSQEALSERRNKQQQDPQDVPVVNMALETHEKSQQAVLESRLETQEKSQQAVLESRLEHNPLQSKLPQKTAPSHAKMYQANSTRLSYPNATVNTSLLGGNSNNNKTSGTHVRFNNSYAQNHPQDTYVVSSETRNTQSRNQETKHAPVEDASQEAKNKTSEAQRKVDKSDMQIVNAQLGDKEGNVSSRSPEVGVADTGNRQSSNLNPGGNNEHMGNPSNLVNSNNQWTKYEFNNAQQQHQQQQQESQQLLQQQQESQQFQQQQQQLQQRQQQDEESKQLLQRQQQDEESKQLLQRQQQDEESKQLQQQQQQESQQQQQQREAQQLHQQQQPQQQDPQQQPQIGGINLSWDWEDFSVMFNSYGAAEMKVRRSPHPTTGEPWPLPQYYSKKNDRVYKLSKDLRFIPTGVKCDILEDALTRHLQRTLRGCVEDMYDNLQNAEGSPIEDPSLRYEREEFLKAPIITRVEVKVRKPCEKYPSLESDESYDLVVKKRKTYIWANEVWGALRGLETFGHLVWRGIDGFLYIKETVISDYPRFPHRGLHIDTSRHFLFKEVILDILDSMEMNKLNVFHWHIVDDQSFPYESKVYPELSRKGAFHPSYVYTLEDIAEIIEYARLRGIRVMPEFDTPGHTFAWGLSRPELLTQCYSGSVPVKGYLGPIDPSKNSTYRFLQSLFKEITEVFKDQYLHLGGDEVPLGCWQSNPEIAAFAQELSKKPQDPQQNHGQYVQNANFGGGWSMWSEDIRRVYEYYENRLINIVNEIGQKRKKGIKYVMWQEVMNNNLQLPNDTIIQVWMGDMADVMRATSMGYQVIYSTCWYMDHIEYGTKWPKYYNCDPVDQSFGFHIDEKKVLGGEAAFWAEYFSNENLIPLMWPRASAAAERLWSNKEVKNLDKAAERLAEHRCRMIKRGINAGEINGPGYCLHSPPKRRLFNDTAGCKGGNCSRTYNFVQIEDFEVHVSQRGGSLADCGNVFTQGNSNVFILLTLALVVVVALYALSKSSSQFHRMRICKNRSILIVFVGVLLVYLLCYTTIWMRAFEFSGSFHKTLQEDNRLGFDGSTDDDGNNFRPISH